MQNNNFPNQPYYNSSSSIDDYPTHNWASDLSAEQIINLLPKINRCQIPHRFCLDVPFIQQEKFHYSGAACVSMIQHFYRIPVESQETIAEKAGWTDWNTFDHSTFREKLARYFVEECDLLFGNYYPQGILGPYLKNGILATNLIRKYYNNILEHDFFIFKSLIYTRKAPTIIRLHITHIQYPMPEEIVSKLDVSGHAVVLLGWDEEGFIVHDPWNRKQWGGEYGGPYQKLPYSMFLDRPPMDVSQDFIGTPDILSVKLNVPREAVYTTGIFTLITEITFPGIKDVLIGDPLLQNVKVQLICPKNCIPITSITQNIGTLRSGEKKFVGWKIRNSDQSGSFPFYVKCTGEFNLPSIPWEKFTKPVSKIIVGQGHSRIVVHEKEFLKKYSMLQKPK